MHCNFSASVGFYKCNSPLERLIGAATGILTGLKFLQNFD